MYAATGLSGIGDSLSDATAYLRNQWSRFVALSPQILDAQHRAAVATYEATERGDTEQADQARELVHSLADLQRRHDAAVRTMDTVRDYVGLSGYRGLGVIPAIQITVITGLALTVAWFFRAYAAQARMLDMIEAGTLTPEQAADLTRSVGASPGGILGNAGQVARYALLAGLAFLALRAFEVFKPNPPLIVFDKNPPDDDDPEEFGEEVYAVYYRHAEDGGNYVHEFEPGVEMHAHNDGSVGLSHTGGRRVWEEF